MSFGAHGAHGGSHGIWRYSAAALADHVTSVPDQPAVSFDQFAGFVNISDDATRRDIFYWFVESERSPADDPVLLWSNGGPGCSGLLGKLTEMGPFRTVLNGSSLDFMPYAWNREANVIFVEQPLFVGYSISDDPADTVTDDELNARRLTTFVDRWLTKFPGYRGNDFYLSSESYGGHCARLRLEPWSFRPSPLDQTSRPCGDRRAAHDARHPRAQPRGATRRRRRAAADQPRRLPRRQSVHRPARKHHRNECQPTLEPRSSRRAAFE